MAAAADYDARYLAGVLFFNRRDFFEAHEVWEELWADNAGPDRSFYQGLIQAAVGLLHFENGNLRGARKLYRTSRAYMEPFFPAHRGLDVAGFWAQMERCFAALAGSAEPPPDARPPAELIPTITLDPPPAAWPDPEAFLPADEARDE
jgi:predicted metal-dependent hydrolase